MFYVLKLHLLPRRVGGMSPNTLWTLKDTSCLSRLGFCSQRKRTHEKRFTVKGSQNENVKKKCQNTSQEVNVMSGVSL